MKLVYNKISKFERLIINKWNLKIKKYKIIIIKYNYYKL